MAGTDEQTPRRKRLELFGVDSSTDEHALVLRDNTGRHYTLPVDQQVFDAVRTMKVTENPRQAEEAVDPVIGPREIQSLIRAGLTAEDISAEHGIDLAKVQRFETPVLMEREHMADRARNTEFRRTRGALCLGDLVEQRLGERGDDLGSLEWDSWKRGDGRWNVQATWLAMGTEIGEDQLASARWIFDPVGRTIVADDAAARALIDDVDAGETSEPARRVQAGGDPYAPDVEDDELTAVVRATAPSVVPTQASGPAAAWTPVLVDGGEEQADEDVQEQTLDDASSAPALLDEDQSIGDEYDGVDEPAVEPAAPTKKAGKRKGRAHVPSWDEILLGTQGPDRD